MVILPTREIVEFKFDFDGQRKKFEEEVRNQLRFEQPDVEGKKNLTDQAEKTFDLHLKIIDNIKLSGRKEPNRQYRN